MQTPAANVTDRIAWAGERFADLCEGSLPETDGWIVWNYLLGWADLCSADDRRQYNAMAGTIERLLRQN